MEAPMSALELLLRQPWMARLGWTLVHFLWQGTVIAAAYAAAHGLGGRLLSARGRYALACAALTAMVAAPPVTFLASGVVTAATPALAIAAGPAWGRALPWLAVIWAAGVALFSARLIGGWRVVARMRRVAVSAPPAEWREALDALMARMRVAAPVRLLASALASTPTVVGWLRPVILVPVEALTGMPAEQMRALLAHELAHILRRDYLVNILQSVAEAALFYHPAVWWISARIRAEREACCDDLAVEATGDVLAYASALADLDSRRRARLRLATAANGGSLVSRIRRLLGQSEPFSHTLPDHGAVWALSLVWLAGVGAAVIAHGAQPQAEASIHAALGAFAPPVAAAAPATPRMAPPLRIRPAAAPLAAALLFDPFFAMPQAPASEPDTQLASVSGLVMSPAGMPVARAQVSLYPTAPPSPPAAGAAAQQPQRPMVLSGADGKFAFEKVTPGAYRLYVSHPIYLNPSIPGQPWVTGAVMTLAAGQRVEDVSVILMEPATVVGRTVDEDGDPVSRVNVQILRYDYNYGRRRAIIVSRATSGDSGEFRVSRVPPGRYLIKAETQPTWTADERAPVPAVKPGQKYMRPESSYYGGARRIADAMPVDIGPGELPLGNIKMWNRLILHVRGKVVGDPALLQGARVLRVPSDPSAGFTWMYGADIRNDGSFDMANMWPAEFTVGVFSQKFGYLGWTGIVVPQEDLENVVINASAAALSGTVTTEGVEPGSAVPMPPMRLQLTSAASYSVITMAMPVKSDGSFTLPYVAPGKYTIELMGLPPGSYIKTARLAAKDALNEPLDWGGRDNGTLEIVISPKAATVEGTLQDGDGKPVPGTVTLIPDPPRPGFARLYSTTNATQQGRFHLPGVTPGKYKVYAWEEIENTAHWDPNFIRPFESRGEFIEVGEGGRATVSLKRISAPAMRDALRKAGL
jgi:beta-lactamase regulating signal transducer with metallopeptidase domain